MTISKRESELANILERYIAAYPAFRMKPVGAPGSQARDEQERLMALEQTALKILGEDHD